MDPSEDTINDQEMEDLERELENIELEVNTEVRAEEILNRDYNIGIIDVNKSIRDDEEYDDPDADIDDKIVGRRVNKR